MPSLIHADKLSQASSSVVSYNVLRIKFGNGIEQRSKDGINNRVETWNLVWENMSLAEMNDLVTFFDNLAGVYYFTWVPFGDTVTKKFILEGQLAKTPRSGNMYNVSGTVTQTYDL